MSTESEEPMTQRIAYERVGPGAAHAMLGMERYVRESGLESGLLELVRMRASQINGCAYCLDMHSKDARAAGETEQRLYVLDAWREAPFYTPRERAALAWTEAVTRVSDGVPDALFATVREQFSEKEIVDLTLAIVTINGWNRLAIALGADVGSYEPRAAPPARERATVDRARPEARTAD
jgi:AhpD family alkylhydroperoxidase